MTSHQQESAMQTLKRSLWAVAALVIFGLALWLLHHTLGSFHYQDIVREVHVVPGSRLLAALVLTAVSYLVLTSYDLMAVRYLCEKLAPGKVMLASFVSYAVGNTIGLSLLMATSVRYRFYSSWGLAGEKILKLVGFTVTSFWLGLLAVAAIVFIGEPLALPASLHLPFHSAHPLGWVCLLICLGYLLLLGLKRDTIRVASREFELPTLPLGLAQLVAGIADWLLAGSVLYVLVGTYSDISLFHFLGVFLLVQLVALISHVPGGLGVFESLMLLMLPGIPASQLLGALLLYRAIYYLLPLCCATVMMVGHELYQRRSGVSRVVRVVSGWGSLLVPQLLAVSIFVAGAILLFSGATPSVPERMHWLHEFMPLPVVEISHFFGSLIGAILLLLARGLQRRLDAAYLLTLILLAVAVLFSLLKGGDYEEAILLLVLLAVLWPCRSYFFRKSSLFAETFSAGWIASILIVLLCSAWLGLFAYKHVDYSHELWWHFSFRGEASRFLRAAVGSGILLLLYALARLLKPAAVNPDLPDAEALAQAALVVGEKGNAMANLAFMGDKSLLFSPGKDGFIMYGVEKKSWVSMGDPVAEPTVARDLAWQFREMVEEHGGQTIFYEVGPELLHLYLDMGLALFKFGETAKVDLAGFSMEGKRRGNMRTTLRKMENEGYRFEVVEAEAVGALLPDLKEISDSWLATKNVREKGFSLGCFDEKFLRHFPAALVRQGEQIVAFVNLWPGAGKKEIAIDLMRYRPDSPNGIMDYLFIELILWAREQGYSCFDLGMAPLSGLENRPFAPLWHKVGAFIYNQGEHFYNFEGLRAYKEKFDPLWEPRYIACPGGLSFPQVLLNIAALTSGGMKGIISR